MMGYLKNRAEKTKLGITYGIEMKIVIFLLSA
jgi:hypothetical protein